MDTSGSMDRVLLGKGLGAIASYAAAHQIGIVRLIYADAKAYDAGYISSRELQGYVKVLGRGGTVLQPAIDLLSNAPDFPTDAPILVITDGLCDKLSIVREHAFLLPRRRNLPFKPTGAVFYMS